MPASAFVSDPDRSLCEHIDYLWGILTRHPREHPAGSSLLPLPYNYVVPGGRFTELYYWDSYFTMLGLEETGCHDLLRAMADNFAYLIDTYGRIPNGNRTYYLSRSQPPVFVLMTELFEETGVTSVELIARTEAWIAYDFPPDYGGSKQARGWSGQKQQWFAFRFTGEESEIDLEAHGEIEFDAWRWGPLSEAPDQIVPFKRAVYEQVVAVFAPLVV